MCFLTIHRALVVPSPHSSSSESIQCHATVLKALSVGESRLAHNFHSQLYTTQPHALGRSIGFRIDVSDIKPFY
jgi:hypothetical protein